jgi:deoxyribodipyrimidine photo-lyase
VNAIRLFANIEYEVDELRRDITVCNLAKDKGILPNFLHDKLIVEPGLLSTKQGKPFSV